MSGKLEFASLAQWQARLDFAAKVVAILAALFVVWQYRSAQEASRKQVAIEAVTHVKSKEILEALVRLEEHLDSNSTDYPEQNLDVALVMSWYDHLGLLYLGEGLANRCIIQGAARPYSRVIQRVLAETRHPPERQLYFDLLVNRLSSEECQPPRTSK